MIAVRVRTVADMPLRQTVPCHACCTPSAIGAAKEMEDIALDVDAKPEDEGDIE